jgi:DNA polymerase-3 subunit beta
MKLACSQEHLAAALATVARVVKSGASTPVLGRILLEANADPAGTDTVRLTGTDGTTSIETTITATVATPGTALVDGTSLSRLIALMHSPVVDLETEEPVLQIHCGETAVGLVLDTSVFPTRRDTAPATGRLAAPALATAIHRVLTSANPGDATDELASNVFFTPSTDGLELTATDRHRLSFASLPWEATAESVPAAFAVPAAALSEVSRVAAHANTETLSVSFGTDEVSFADGATRITTKTAHFSPPDLRGIINATAETCVRLDRGALLGALARSEVIAGALDPVALRLGATSASLKVRGPDDSFIEEETPASGPASLADAPIDLVFNPKFLISVLKAIDAEHVFMGVNGPLQPVMLAPEHAKTHRHVLMPMRGTRR